MNAKDLISKAVNDAIAAGSPIIVERPACQVCGGYAIIDRYCADCLPQDHPAHA